MLPSPLTFALGWALSRPVSIKTHHPSISGIQSWLRLVSLVLVAFVVAFYQFNSLRSIMKDGKKGGCIFQVFGKWLWFLMMMGRKGEQGDDDTDLKTYTPFPWSKAWLLRQSGIEPLTFIHLSLLSLHPLLSLPLTQGFLHVCKRKV